MISKKSLISVIEVSILALMFVMLLGYINSDFFIDSNSQVIYSESFFDTLLYYDNDVFLEEDLSVSSITANWSAITNLLNSSLISYSIEISNSTVNKTIFSCSENYGKHITERVVSIKDNSLYEFRIVRFGICY